MTRTVEIDEYDQATLEYLESAGVAPHLLARVKALALEKAQAEARIAAARAVLGS